MLRIAHLSDTHFGVSDSAGDRCRRILDHIASLDPAVDVVLVTGDITDHGSDEEYAEAAEILDGWSGPPMLVCPGNHDVRAGYARWRDHESDGSDEQPTNSSHDVAGARFLMLDSMVSARDGKRVDHGHLRETTLAWLDRQLASRPDGMPAFVCLHHPPVPLYVDLMDPIRLDNPEQLAEILHRHRGVVAILVGHAHTMAATRFAGLPVLVGGGSASTVTLDEEPFAKIDLSQPPTLALHLVDDPSGDPSGLVTHFRALP